MSSEATATAADPAAREGGGQEGGGGTLAAVPLGKDGLPLLSHEGEDEEEEETDEEDLWDVDGDMTAEQVTAALAEEKRRKKVHCDDTQTTRDFPRDIDATAKIQPRKTYDTAVA